MSSCSGSGIGAVTVVQRQADHEPGLARPALHRDGPVVGLDDRRDDGQAEAGAGAPGRSGGAHPAGVGPGEALEDPIHDLRGDAGTVVGDGDQRAVADGAQGGLHPGPGRGVGPGVGEQVRDDLVQPELVRRHGDQLVGQRQGPGVVGAGGPAVADRVDQQRVQVGGLDVQRRAGVQPGQQQQVLDEPRHPIGLRLHPRHRVRGVRRDRLAAALGELGVAPDGGQRVAQLVRRVGHELTDLGLARLPGGQRLLDVVEHVVEREPDPADLGVGIGVGRRHPDGEGDLAAVQRQLRHLLSRGRDPVQGTQASFDQRPADQRGGADGEDGQHDLHRDQVGQGRIDLGERQPHRVRDRAVVAGPADDAIPAELGQVDRGGPSDGGLGGELGGCLVVGPGRLGATPVVLQHDRLGLDPVDRDQHQRADRLTEGLDALRWGVVTAGRTGHAPHRPALRVHQLGVQLAGQLGAGGERGEQAEQDRDHGHQADDAEHQLARQACRARWGRRRGGVEGVGRRGHHTAGRSTYPAPRMVWIIGARLASIFLRRYEM